QQGRFAMTTAIASTASAVKLIPLKLIPLTDLEASKEVNARKQKLEGGSLRTSIERHGLIVPLFVRKNKHDGYRVLDGGRRLDAIREIVKAAKGDHPLMMVPCLEVGIDGAAALEVSMVINTERKNLHPVDE